MEWDTSYNVYWLSEPGDCESYKISDGDALGLAKHKDTGEIRWGMSDYHFCGDPQCCYGPFSGFFFKWNNFYLINEQFWKTLEKYEINEDSCWDLKEFQSLLDELKK